MIESLSWEKMDGLIPAVVQDAATRDVLMLGYMDREALQTTLSSGRVTFFSRSKGRQWTKGETSGNYLATVSVEADCDNDAILITAKPGGPTCHRGTASCFHGDKPLGIGFLGRLSEVIEGRYEEKPAGSYTTKLFESGTDRMAQKVGEEGVEVVLAAKNPDDKALVGEAADLVFHLMVLLRSRGLSLSDVGALLQERHK